MQRRTVALLVACGGAFLAFLDTTIVNTAFPDIRGAFPGTTPAQLSWVLDGYFIVLAAFLVPAGGIADRLGRRRVFMIGVVGFVSPAPSAPSRRAGSCWSGPACCRASRRRSSCRPRWRCCCRCSRSSAGRPASASGERPPRWPRRSVRRSAACWSRSPTGAGSSSSTCRSAPSSWPPPRAASTRAAIRAPHGSRTCPVRRSPRARSGCSPWRWSRATTGAGGRRRFSAASPRRRR